MLKLPLTEDVLVEDVVRDFPAAVGLLREHGVVCIKCGEPAWGTLGEQIAERGQDVAQVLAALNQALARQG